jgi:PAS domain S-box-containing protein
MDREEPALVTGTVAPGRRPARPVSRGVVLGFALAFATLLANAILSYLNVRRLAANDELVARSHEVLTQLEGLLSGLKDAETGQRGYLLTGEDAYLEPYRDARGQIGDRLRRLQTLTADSPGYVQELAALRGLIDDKLRELELTIDLRKADFEAARRLVRTGEGKAKMDAVRDRVGELEQEEHRRLDERAADSRASYHKAVVTDLFTVLLCIGVVAAAYVLARRELVARAEAETALRRSQERLGLAQSAGRIGAFEWDLGTDRSVWTEELEALYGLPPGGLGAGRDGWRQRLHPEDRAATERAYARAADDGEFETEFRVVRPDGAVRWVAGRGQVFRDGAGRPVRLLGVNMDITDRKEAEDGLCRAYEELEARVRERTTELAAANDALRRSNSELEMFASVASHDLQEPLRKIQAFGDRLQTKFAATLGEQGREYLERMLAAAGRMRTLIDDLLTYSRVTTKAQPFAPVDLARVAREVVSDLEGRVQQTGGRVELGELPTVEADPLQMRQLLQNLAGNALKFHRPAEPPVVRVWGEVTDGPPGPHCRLYVKDNGIGFDEVYLDRIFQLFQRLHGRHEYEGTGMGLAICRKIAERHGGSITAHSAPGQGATFVVTLPLAPQAGVNGGGDGEPAGAKRQAEEVRT